MARVDSYVRGYHVYMESWEAAIGKVLECKREVLNLSESENLFGKFYFSVYASPVKINSTLN